MPPTSSTASPPSPATARAPTSSPRACSPPTKTPWAQAPRRASPTSTSMRQIPEHSPSSPASPAPTRARCGGRQGPLFGDAYAAPLHGVAGQEGGDGHVLAFASKAPVAGEDSDGGFRDVFRYDAEDETLERISRRAPRGADNGPFDATVNPAVQKILEFNFNEMTRWMSEDGQVIAFATEEPLLPGDEDEAIQPLRLGRRPARRRLHSGHRTARGRPGRRPDRLLDRHGAAAHRHRHRQGRLRGARGWRLPAAATAASAVQPAALKGSVRRDRRRRERSRPPPSSSYRQRGSTEPPAVKGFVRRGGKCVKIA